MHKAWLWLVAACVVGCGARADIGDDAITGGSGGAGGAGGAGVSSGHTGTSQAATGTTGSASGAVSTSSTGGPGATSSAGSGPGTSSSASGGQVCPGFGDPCSSCLSTSCPMTYCTCYNNAECLALIKCDNACKGDKNCQQACLTAHPNGISDLYLLTDCAGTICAPACPGNNPLDACTKCLLEDCSAAMNACLAEPECLQLYNCLKGCGNANLACQQGCYQAHGGGVPTLQAVLDCGNGVCAPVCK